tara:strand:+ start:676 stop:1281 length:606 start_codon:yes stop_codon:yes gene_type:complete
VSIGIELGFVLIATLILWFIIGSKGHWLSKAVVIFSSLYFCLSVGFSIKDYMGWPTEEDLPDKFVVYWLVIEEPDKQTGNKGSVYIWVQPLSKAKNTSETWEDYLLSFYNGQSKPRAHQMSYSKDLHERAQEAIEMIRRGQRVGGLSGNGKKGEGKKGEGKGQGNNQDGGSGGGSLTRNGGIIFHQLPPTRLPDKIGGNHE